MRRLIGLVALVASVAMASDIAVGEASAPWDGVHGAITLRTVAYWGASPVTIITPSSIDASVSFFVISIGYLSSAGPTTMSLVVAVHPYSFTRPDSAVFPVDIQQITSVEVSSHSALERYIYLQPADSPQPDPAPIPALHPKSQTNTAPSQSIGSERESLPAEYKVGRCLVQ